MTYCYRCIYYHDSNEKKNKNDWDGVCNIFKIKRNKMSDKCSKFSPVKSDNLNLF